MATTINSLGLGRVGLKVVFLQQAANYPDQAALCIGRKMQTKQQYERFKSIIPLGLATATNEGEQVKFDDMLPLFVRDFYPQKYTKGIKLSFESELTDQYGVLKNMMPDIAKSFVQRKNQTAANIFNNGFTTTTDGMNSETLFSTSHNMILATGSNQPSTSLPLGPLALEQGLNELRLQKNARGVPMPALGKIDLLVPPNLDGQAARILRSEMLPMTSNNDVNVPRDRITFKTIDYFTSTTAWFLKTAADDGNGLFHLQQSEFQIKELPLTDAMMTPWIAWEIYVFGWYDWHGVWGTPGL